MKVISRQRLTEILEAAGIPRRVVSLADDDYALLSRTDIEQFGRDFKWWLVRNGVDRFRPEAFDCDDYALLAHSMAVLNHRNSGAECAVAFGQVWMMTDVESHAVNLAVLTDETVTVREPQILWNAKGSAEITMSEVPLSDVQLWSHVRL